MTTSKAFSDWQELAVTQWLSQILMFAKFSCFYLDLAYRGQRQVNTVETSKNSLGKSASHYLHFR